MWTFPQNSRIKIFPEIPGKWLRRGQWGACCSPWNLGGWAQSVPSTFFEQCGARGVSGGTMKNNYCIYIYIYVYIYVLYYKFISFISMKWVMHLVIICSTTPPILRSDRWDRFPTRNKSCGALQGSCALKNHLVQHAQLPVLIIEASLTY